MSQSDGPTPQRRASDRTSGWHRGRRTWDLPPNCTKLLLALIPVLLAIIAATNK